MGKRNTKSLIPAHCDFDQICRLRRDNWSVGDHRISTDGYNVWITTQKHGEAPSQSVELTRKVFNQLVKYYTTPKRVVRK